MSQTAAPQMAPPRAESAPARPAPAAREKPAALGNQALLRRLQAKLTIGATDDPLEREADNVAAQVMRMPDSAPATTSAPPRISRKCEACEDDAKLQKKPDGEAPAGEAPASVEATLRAPGQPMAAADRAFFEPRFGADFSDVRIHDDAQAANSAAAIGARAYAVENHIVLGPNRPAPGSPSHTELFAHELTHVVQQSAAPRAARRDLGDEAKKIADAAKKQAEDAAKQKLVDLGNSPVGPPSGFTGKPKCGPTFCQPYESQNFAEKSLLWARPLLLAGIALKVNPRVVPLWDVYLNGGSAPRDLTKDFGADFTASPSTDVPTRFLVTALALYIRANFETVLGGANTATIDATSQLSTARTAIDTPEGDDEMNFNIPGDIPGNLAGGIGKDQLAHPIGKQPSPFNDSRDAKITAKLTRNPNGGIHVEPHVRFTVKDTIDLCPGDCGNPEEMKATVAMSRFEASGLVGDVPFTVEFDGTAARMEPWDMDPISKKPVPATTMVPVLVIRDKPDNTSKVNGNYGAGAKFNIICQVIGRRVKGVDESLSWFKTDKGYVYADYVILIGGGEPIFCDELTPDPTAPPQKPP